MSFRLMLTSFKITRGLHSDPMNRLTLLWGAIHLQRHVMLHEITRSRGWEDNGKLSVIRQREHLLLITTV